MGPLSLAPLGLGLRRRGPPSALGTYYAGAALGNFSSSNTVKTAAGGTVAFAPGMTLLIVFQTLGVPASTEVVLSSSRGSYSSGAGWRVERENTVGAIYVLSADLIFYQLTTVPAAYGITALAIVWRASDGMIQHAMNGAALLTGDKFPSGIVAPDGTSLTSIGSPNGDGSAAAASTRVLAFATLNREISSAEAQAFTFTSGNRFVLSAAARSGAVVDCQPSRDWNGSASSFTTQGSSPVTFNVAGTPKLIACDEIRVPAAQIPYADSRTRAAALGTDGTAYEIHEPFARALLATDGRSVGVDVYATLPSNGFGSTAADVGLWVNGTYSTQVAPPAFGAPCNVDVQLAAGAGKSVALAEGGQFYANGTALPLSSLEGLYLLGLRLPVFATDGSTKANSAVVTPGAADHVVVILGDSIGEGFVATPMQQNGVAPLMRAHYASISASVAVLCKSIGTEALANWNAEAGGLSAMAARVAAMCAGRLSNRIVFQVMTNDFSQTYCTPTQFGSFYATFLDALHALVPGVQVWCVSAFQRLDSEGPNAGGFHLSDYRSAGGTAAAARSSYCTSIDGTSIITNGQISGDGVHPTTSGVQTIATYFETMLGLG